MSTVITTNTTSTTTTATATTSSSSTLLAMSKMSTSTPQKQYPEASILADISGLADTETSNVFNDDTTTSISPNQSSKLHGSGGAGGAVGGSGGFNKSNSTSNSPVAKRHINSGSITRTRPQSSYSARVLIFEDSDQELGGGGSNNSGNSVQSIGNNTHDGTTKSSTGLDMFGSSPKNDSSISSSQSLLRNLNLTKSSSGGLSGSSISLPARGYGALLRKISYQQHTYSLRSASNGEYKIYLNVII